MTRNGRSRPASRSSSTSRSGRPPSSCRRATGSRSRYAARTMRSTAPMRRSPHAPYPMKGVGPFLHVDPQDRPAAIFACENSSALRRRQDALSLVAGDPAGVVFRHLNREERSMRRRSSCGGCCWPARLCGRHASRSNIRAASSPSSCPIRRVGRPTSSRARSRRRLPRSSDRTSSWRTSAAAAPTSRPRASRALPPTATRCCCTICRSRPTCRSTATSRSIPRRI